MRVPVAPSGTSMCHPTHIVRRGFTLVEMLVSLALTLLLVLAVVQAFDLLGNTIQEGRSKIELAGSMRNATDRLQRDLDAVTCRVEPWIDPDAAAGYFEIYEGVATDGWTDANRDGVLDPNDPQEKGAPPSHIGDLDDVLMCTVYSEETPFRGRGLNGETIESTVAEVVWWVAQLDVNNNGIADVADPPILLRRVLLVRPDSGFPRRCPGKQLLWHRDQSPTVLLVARCFGTHRV